MAAESRVRAVHLGNCNCAYGYPLPNIEHTHAQFAYINFSNKGIADF
jgi:hypothetical protein